MKVLWFCNTSAAGEEFLNANGVGGGWLKSLDRQIQEYVDLHIAFYYPYQLNQFNHGKTSYHPIYSGNIIWNTFKKHFIVSEKDEQDFCKYSEIIKQVKPDIIHIHGTENPFGCIIGKVKIPVVVSIQGNITVYHHKFFAGIENKYLSMKVTAKSLKQLFVSSNFRYNYKSFTIKKQIELKNLKNTKYIIGRTEWDKRITSVLAPDSVYFHGDEILRDAFYENQWEYPAQKELIVHSTNGDSFYKGFETICLALNELHKIHIDITWQVAGITEKSLIYKIVKKKLKKNFPTKGLVLLGTLPEQELIESMKKSNIYVMSSHIENSPNNLCEAMIIGMPCIATFAGGTGSLLKDKEEGLLIQAGDPWVMAGAILELLNNKERAITMGVNARTRALQRHNKSRIVTDLIETYQTIINENYLNQTSKSVF